MKTAITQPWIEEGYRIFAYEGRAGLKVERLSKRIGKNKSSFYHHFADMNLFMEVLLEYHLQQAHQMAEKEMNCSSQKELVDVLIDHKIDLLFSRQLRIHRNNSDFETCFLKTNQITVPAIKGIWAEMLGLQQQIYLAELVFQLTLENFYLQITDETLNEIWLNNYITQLRTLIKAFQTKATSDVQS